MTTMLARSAPTVTLGEAASAHPGGSTGPLSSVCVAAPAAGENVVTLATCPDPGSTQSVAAGCGDHAVASTPAVLGGLAMGAEMHVQPLPPSPQTGVVASAGAQRPPFGHGTSTNLVGCPCSQRETAARMLTPPIAFPLVQNDLDGATWPCHHGQPTGEYGWRRRSPRPNDNRTSATRRSRRTCRAIGPI